MIKGVIEKIINLPLSLIGKIKIFYQILLIIVLMVVLLGIQGLLGVRIINKLESNSKIISKNTEGISDLKTIQKDLFDMHLRYVNDVNTSQRLARSNYTIAGKVSLHGKLEILKERAPYEVENILDRLKEIEDILEQPATPENLKLFESALDGCYGSLDLINSDLLNKAHVVITENGKFTKDANRNTIILWIVGTVVAVVIGFIIALSISGPLQKVIDVAKALAGGDLSKTINIKGSAEITKMCDSLNIAINGLRNLVTIFRNIQICFILQVTN